LTIHSGFLYAILTLEERGSPSLGKHKYQEDNMAEIGYCMKCKQKREMKETTEVTMKNGRKALKGKCTVCGTGMYKILGK
jgi:hypothetical protein